MKSRVDTIHSLLHNYNLSYILISDPIDITYISGFSSSNAALLIGKRSNRIITDFRYSIAVKTYCQKNPEWKYTMITSCMSEAIASFITSESRVGYQSDHYTVDNFKKLKKKCCGARFISCSKNIHQILLSKSDKEIRAMKKAAAIGDKALERIYNDLVPGITEWQCARQLERYCSELGSEKPSFDTIVLFGENSALPHGHPGKRALKNGDFILIDFGCTVNGLVSDMTRTLFMGKATRRQRFLYSVVKDAQQYACDHLCSNMRAKDIDALARTCIDKAGFSEQFGHALGHGVGRRVHESPRISMHTTQIVPENAVITIEPGIYLPKYGGIRIEDMVVIKKGGIQTLTTTSKELTEV